MKNLSSSSVSQRMSRVLSQIVAAFMLLGTLILSVSPVSTASAATDKPSVEKSQIKKGEGPLTQNTTPHQVIEDVTRDLLVVMKGGESALKANPEKFFSDVEAILDPVVSFPFIARNVMTSRYWDEASEEQQAQFITTFKRGMIETFAKGMSNYSDLDIRVLPPEEDVSGQKRVLVLQEVKTADGVTKVSYTMARKDTGEWKLINVVLNGVNLGKSFRDQFLQAHKKHAGNIDDVIASWGQEA